MHENPYFNLRIHERMNKHIWYIHDMEYYLSIKQMMDKFNIIDRSKNSILKKRNHTKIY